MPWGYVIPLPHCETEPQLRKLLLSHLPPSPNLPKARTAPAILPLGKGCPARGLGGVLLSQGLPGLSLSLSPSPSRSPSCFRWLSLISPNLSSPHRDPGWGRAEVEGKAEGEGGHRRVRGVAEPRHLSLVGDSHLPTWVFAGPHPPRGPVCFLEWPQWHF